MHGPDAMLPSRRPGTARIEGTLKTILNVNGSLETYDLATDPGETHNLAPSADSRRKSWRGADHSEAWTRPRQRVPSTRNCSDDSARSDTFSDVK